MSKKFNNDYLISKISALMVNNSMTREKGHRRSVCRSQTSTMSFTIRAVKRFAIEQIFDIAHYFGVSIDWLMGNQGGRCDCGKVCCRIHHESRIMRGGETDTVFRRGR